MRQIPVRKILKWTGYPLFFLVCFVFFAYKTFPYDRLADRVVQEARLRGYEVEIIDLTHSGLTGLAFEGVRVVLPPEGEGSPPLDVIFDELTVSTSLLSLMSDTKSYSFEAELAGGEAEGSIKLAENDTEFDLEVEEIDLAGIPALRRYTKVPIAGTLNGEVDLAMPPEIEQSAGKVDIAIEGLTVGDGKSKLDIPDWGGLTVDRADAGNLELLATIEQGNVQIERATSRGKDLELDMLGKVRLLRPLKRSDLKVMLRVKIQDAYKERSTKVATMLELASSGLKSAMTSDGAIQYSISGPIGGRLRPRAAGQQEFQAPK